MQTEIYSQMLGYAKSIRLAEGDRLLQIHTVAIKIRHKFLNGKGIIKNKNRFLEELFLTLIEK